MQNTIMGNATSKDPSWKWAENTPYPKYDVRTCVMNKQERHGSHNTCRS